MSIHPDGSIKRLLIANRGEIALRIMRACREMGIVSVAVFGEGEDSAPHVRYADEAYRLSSSSGLAYLDIDAVLDVAASSHADAIHPGYGFLAENATFARRVREAGIIFVGPSPESISAMGDKVEARKVAIEAGLSPVPGTREPVATIEDAIVAAKDIGYPVAVKAVGGGGGRGFRVAASETELPDAFTGSSGEAQRYFANPEVYLERYLQHPRHIEVQVFADAHGSVRHWASVIVRCNGVTRNWWKNLRHRPLTPTCVSDCARQPWISRHPWGTSARAPSNTCWTTLASFTSSR